MFSTTAIIPHSKLVAARLCLSIAILLVLSATPIVRSADLPAANLPLKRVVLFSSGVGFFEHDGDIEGDGKVDLKFNTDDVNDLLKSMVLQDLGGGKISTVTYGSKDPIEKTLKTFAIDLTTSPTLANLLRQVRGEVVELEAPDKITGSIVGVETRRVQVGKDETIEVDYLNLLTESGLRGIALKDVGRIKLANAALDKELRQALQVLATSHATDKKTVSLNFLGNGKRPVSVGYILQAPIWKTSYRLVLRGKAPAMMQGWAIVENTTEEDWKDVSLMLISGRPISFVMNLYDPLYVSRPTVEPELFASLRPQTYGQDLADKERRFADASRRKSAAVVEPRVEVAANAAQTPSLSGRMPVARQAGSFDFRHAESDKSVHFDMDQLGQGVQSAAQASNLGELFQYKIETPVSLARQRSAMLPIVNQTVQAEKVSIYNQRVHTKHPLNGLRLKNSTDLHLMQGPITVFDGGAYAGDARIEDLPPGSERLVSYAIDLDMEVAPEAKPHPEQLTSVKIVKGVAHTTHKYRRESKYTVKNSGKDATKLLIEYPLEAQWTLVKPDKPSEKTRDMYRFVVDAEPGKPADLVVTEEMTQTQQIAVSNIDDNMNRIFLAASVVDEKVKKALQEVVARKQKITEVAGRLQQAQQQIASIGQEQARIRQNMTTLDKTSELYRRYVKKFGDQEDEVEKLQQQVVRLTEEVRSMQVELDRYLASLEVG